MRTADEVAEFALQARYRYVHGCKRCKGVDEDCSCYRKYQYKVAAYEACIPKDFWNVQAKDITHNIEVFTNVVEKYVKRLDKALLYGYGLVLLGDNGVGKTYFLSYILMKAIRANRTVYYTTLPQLDYDIKRGFKDTAAEDRLRWLLTSDFVAIDEMGKEHRATTGYMDVQIERILKQRCDDSMPVLLATNMDFEALLMTYGPTISSIIGGKFQPVTMKPGDYRAKMAVKMDNDMEYGK